MGSTTLQRVNHFLATLATEDAVHDSGIYLLIYLLLIFRLMGTGRILSWSSKSKCLLCLIRKELSLGMLNY